MQTMNTLRSIASAALLLLSFFANAGEREIRAALRATIPAAEFISIQKLPYAELYEVAVQRGNDKAVYYSDTLGRIMIIGNLIETRTDRNLTEERLRSLSKVRE